MSPHFSGYFEGASTFFLPRNCPLLRSGQFRGQKSLGPLKMSLEMRAHKVIVPQKKIVSRSFLNSGTLIVIMST